jgi:ribosomal-protein-alanine N-acetyltransferase
MMIRQVTEDDLSQVAHIEEVSFQNPYPADIFTFLFEKYREIFLVLEQGGTILGYIAGIDSWREGHIVSLAIHPAWRNKGVATQLVEEICRILKEKGKKRVKLEVRVSNGAALNLYKKIGFEKQKIVQDYYENGEDAVLMKRRLR